MYTIFKDVDSIEQIEERVKKEMQQNSNNIYYYFGCNEEYPQYFMLIYMYKDKKPIKELVKVRCTGLYFHDQQFQSIKDLIIWFKEHLKEREYQKYVKTFSIKKWFVDCIMDYFMSRKFI